MRTIQLVGLLTAMGAYEQTASPQFDVAAVKRLAQPAASSTHTSDPGRLRYTNQVLRPVLAEAYGVRLGQVLGPDWLDSERYDIIATFSVATTKDQVPLMLRNLLVERFHVTVHPEQREASTYDLTVAKNGPKLKEWIESAATPAFPGLLPEEVRNLRRDSNFFPQMPDGRSGLVMGFTGTGRTHLIAVQQTMAQLAGRLPGANGPITDRTGLSGKYNFTLDYELEGDSVAPLAAGQDPPGPSLFTALQQQLGLKLEEKKVSVDVIVIDHIEKVPGEN